MKRCKTFLQFTGVHEKEWSFVCCEQVFELRRRDFRTIRRVESHNITQLPHVIVEIGSCGIGLLRSIKHGSGKHRLVGEHIAHIAEYILENILIIRGFVGRSLVKQTPTFETTVFIELAHYIAYVLRHILL